MATAPTNERIAEMLERVLREIEEIKKTQEKIAVGLRSAPGK